MRTAAAVIMAPVPNASYRVIWRHIGSLKSAVILLPHFIPAANL